MAVLVWRYGVSGREWLVLHRAVFARDDDGDWAWSSPGGRLERGEDPRDAAERELREETGLDLACTPADRVAESVAVFVAEAPRDATVILSAEHDRYEWLPTEQAEARCKPAWAGALFREAL